MSGRHVCVHVWTGACLPLVCCFTHYLPESPGSTPSAGPIKYSSCGATPAHTDVIPLEFIDVVTYEPSKARCGTDAANAELSSCISVKAQGVLVGALDGVPQAEVRVFEVHSECGA